MIDELELENAKSVFRDVLLSEHFTPWQPARVLMAVAKKNKISKSAMREARKELRILSITGSDGEQYWAFPSRVEFPEQAL